MDVIGQRILVMGANGVLGAGIAAELTQRGALVVGTARNAQTAARLAPELHERLLLDVEDEQSVTRLSDYLVAAGVDGIVNCTGIVGFGSAASTTAVDAARLMQVNHLGPASVMSALLPALASSAKAGNRPCIASITGVVAESVFPGMSAYIASKTAHSAWLKALRLDVRRDGIRVLEARPGHTETGLAGRAIFGAAPRFPVGLAPAAVAARIVDALCDETTEIPSAAFSG